MLSILMEFSACGFRELRLYIRQQALWTFLTRSLEICLVASGVLRVEEIGLPKRYTSNDDVH